MALQSKSVDQAGPLTNAPATVLTIALTARVYGVAYRLTGNAEHAATLTSGVLARAAGAAGGWDRQSLDRWAQSATATTFLAQRGTSDGHRGDPCDGHRSDETTGGAPRRGGCRSDEDAPDPVQHALDALTPYARAVVVLSDIAGFSYEEIATTLDIEIGVVKEWVSNGRRSFLCALDCTASSRVRAL
jgi:DNA-directed RNA polymerase specialized sigma24 family protein